MSGWNKTRDYTMNLPDCINSVFKRRMMSVAQSSFQISRMVPQMTAMTTVDKEEEGKGGRREREGHMMAQGFWMMYELPSTPTA